MKKRIERFIILTAILFLALSCPVQASETQAIKKQIKILETGIQKHNLKMIKKVVKKPYSTYCDFSRIDRLVGKDFLKDFSGYSAIKVKHIDVYGKTANVTLGYQFSDCSIYYFQTHKNLRLYRKYYKENFKKELREVRKQYVEKDLRLCGVIGNQDTTVTMVKKKGKWVFESDPNAIFFDMYSCGYFYCASLCGGISFNDW